MGLVVVKRCFAVFSLLLLTPAIAHAQKHHASPEKQRCVDAATRGQIQRDDQKLSAAAEAFAVCAEKQCPSTVRQSCAEWLVDVKSKMPTVTVHLADASAAQHANVDGKDVAFDSAVTLDPGAHSVRVESPPNKKVLPFVQDFVLEAKETKTIDVVFPAPPQAPEPPKTRPTPLSVYILGGVAVVGVASWATFGLIAKSKTDSLTDSCAPACSEDSRDSAYRLAAIADISLSIAVVSVVLGTVFYLTRPSKPATTTGSSSASSSGITF